MRAAGCILSLALLAGLSGCSWFQSLEIDPTRDWTAQKLYSEARDAMNESNWSLAKDYYTKLEARYPFGTYAQQAQIELAYVYFKDDDAPSAIQQLDRFLRAYVDNLTDKPAGLFIIAFQFTFKCERKLVKQRRVDKFALFVVPADLFHLVGVFCARHNAHKVSFHDVLYIGDADGEGVPF